MGTKKEPGQFDCLSKLKDDEPYFLLKASDPLAAQIVREWAWRAYINTLHEPEKIDEAKRCADQMEHYRAQNNLTPWGNVKN